MPVPDVSIIMGCYRRETELGQALSSIVRQPAAARAEVVVVDNNDTREATLAVLREWGGRGLSFQYVHRPNPGGGWANPCVTWNVGLRLARAPLLILTGPDIVHVGDTLERLVRPHQPGTDRAVFASVYDLTASATERLSECDPRGWEAGDLGRIREDLGLASWETRSHPFLRRAGRFFLGSVRRETALAVGGFDEDFQYGIGYDDDDFIRRLRLHGVEEIYDENAVGLHQWHEEFTADGFRRLEMNRGLFRKKKRQGTRVANERREWGALGARDYCEGVPAAALPEAQRSVKLLACVLVGADTRWLWRCLRDLQTYADAIVVLRSAGSADVESITGGFSRVRAVERLPDSRGGRVTVDLAPWAERLDAEWMLVLRGTEMTEDGFGAQVAGMLRASEARSFALRPASLWVDEGHYRVDGGWYYGDVGERASTTRVWHHTAPHRVVVGARTVETCPAAENATPAAIQTEFTVADWLHVGSDVARTCVGVAELADVPEEWKKPAPLASVVVLTHNRLPLTQQCLRALLDNTGFPLEVIVVDNGSDDGTQGWLSEFAASVEDRATVKLLLHPRNIGIARAKNEGMRLARGQYILCVDNDIVPPPFWVERIVERLDADSRIGTCAFATAAFRPAAWPARIGGVDVDVTGFGTAVSACYGFRRELLEEVGYLCEDFGLYAHEDLDFGLRVGHAGYLAVRVPDGVAGNLEECTMVSDEHMGDRDPEQEKYRAFKSRQIHAYSSIRERYAAEYALERRPVSVAYVRGRPGPQDRRAWKQISLILLVHEGEEQTREALAALVRALGDVDLQVICVDSGASKGTTEYLHAVGQYTTIPLAAENWSFVAALNAGAREASGDVLIFSHAGVEVSGIGWGEALCRAFETNPGLGLVYGGECEAVDGDAQRIGPHLERLDSWGNWHLFALPWRIWQRLGAFDEGYTGYACEEADLALRCRKHGGWVANLTGARFRVVGRGVQALRVRGGTEAVATNLRHFAAAHAFPLPFDPLAAPDLWSAVGGYLADALDGAPLAKPPASVPSQPQRDGPHDPAGAPTDVRQRALVSVLAHSAGSADQVEAFAERVDKTNPAVVVLSGCGWECSGGGQRPVGLARALAKLGHPVAYHSQMEARSRWDDGVLVVGRDDWGTLEAVVGQNRKGIVVATLGIWIEHVRRLLSCGWRFLYDLVDDWDAFVAAGDLDPAAIAAEPEFFEMAETVICSAPELVERARRLGARDARLILNGGPEVPLVRPTVPPADMLMGGVRAVCVSYLYGSWFDWKILERLAGCEDIATTVVGKYTNVPDWSRVRFVGEKPYLQAMEYMAWAEVAVIPFQNPVVGGREAHICESVDAIKWYDGVAAGVWNVVTPVLTELARRPFTLAAEPDGFPDAVRRAAMQHERPDSAFVRGNAWSARALQFEEVFAAKPRGGAAMSAARHDGASPTAAGRASPMKSRAQRGRQAELRPEPVKARADLPERSVRQEDCRLRVTWEMPGSCNMKPACPYCSNAGIRASHPALPDGFAAMVDAVVSIGEERGPLYISLVYGEPTSHPDVTAAIGRIGRRNKVDIVTNLIFSLDEVADWPRNGNIRLATSFHPHAWKGDIEAFIAKRRMVDADGIECGVCEIVGYPPHVERLVEWRDVLRVAGVEAHIMPFHGAWQGKGYPGAYTAAERALIYGHVQETYGQCLVDMNPKGKLCRTGRDYAFIRWNGDVMRCYMPHARRLGNLGEGFQLLDRATPCPETTCPCPDLWRYVRDPETDETAGQAGADPPDWAALQAEIAGRIPESARKAYAAYRAGEGGRLPRL